MKSTIYILLLTTGLFIFSSPGFAQSSLSINNIDLPDQIATNGIKLVVRDEAGLLWFVTPKGLYRYDGSELLHFGLGSSPALPWLSITALCADKQGNLWIGFQNGAAKFDLKHWTISSVYPYKRTGLTAHDKQITAATCLRDGDVYFGTISGRVYTVKDNYLELVADIGVGRRKFASTGPALAEPAIENIQEPIAGQIWVATGDGMLVCIPKSNHSYGQPVYFNFWEAKPISISSVCYDESGKCLFSVNTRGIFSTNINVLNQIRQSISKDKSNHTFNVHANSVLLPDSMPNENYFFLFYLPDNAIGIVTKGDELYRYIYVYDFEKREWRGNPKSMYRKYPGELVKNISSVPSGNATYISTDGGLTAIHKNELPFRLLLNANNNINSIRGIYDDGDDLYLSSYQQYFTRYDKASGKETHLKTIYVYNILPWGKDSLLLGAEGAGLHWYQISANKLTPIGIKLDVLNGAQVYQSGYISVLCRINRSLLLEGTTRGIHLIDPIKKTVYPVFTHPSAQAMQAVKTNAIVPFRSLKSTDTTKYLVATNAGVFVTDIRNGHTYYLLTKDAPEEVKQLKVFSLLCLNGKTWMGTSGLGILAADSSGRLLPMEWLNANLSNQTVYSLVKSGNHILIGTNQGLNILDLKDSSIVHYDASDGMPSDEFNQSATFKNGQQVYMGTINGIVQWSAPKTNGNKNPNSADIHISKFTVADKNNQLKTSYELAYLQPDSIHIRIPANTRYFTLSFNKPNPQNKNTAYYYRLHPTDAWVNLGAKREITFNQMPPGNYMLQLAQKVEGKIIPDNILQIPIDVLPAYYQTLWFKTLLGLTVIGLIWLIFRYREVQRNKERNLRTKIAGDLHDEVGSSLTRIWHQAQRLLIAKPSKEEAAITTELQSMASSSREAIGMMSDMVWSIDAQFDTQEELILRMKNYVYLLQDEFDIIINIAISHESKKKKISQVIRQNLFLVLKESINNAIKYGDGSEIQIDINFANSLRMVISNSFNQQEKSNTAVLGGRGIENMRRRVQKMNGDLMIEIKENMFTLIVIV